MSREAALVELVDPTGEVTGATTVQDAHDAPGRLHRAFSVLLLDPDGRLLVQQRAAGKTRFPLRWANACCGHPAPGEPVATAAARRLADEIGLRDVRLDQVGIHLYRAADPATTRVEYEYDHVLIGSLPPGVELTLDPSEVAAVRWVAPAELSARMQARPEEYAPWFAGVLAVAGAAIGMPPGD
jgi:isopentenyl-diphosphate Delta-isomerase